MTCGHYRPETFNLSNDDMMEWCPMCGSLYEDGAWRSPGTLPLAAAPQTPPPTTPAAPVFVTQQQLGTNFLEPRVTIIGGLHPVNWMRGLGDLKK